MITLAENLKKLRRQKGLTQEGIAVFLGISFQAVSKWERGEGYPDITMLPVIANYLKYPLTIFSAMICIRRKKKLMNTAICFGTTTIA